MNDDTKRFLDLVERQRAAQCNITNIADRARFVSKCLRAYGDLDKLEAIIAAQEKTTS